MNAPAPLERLETLATCQRAVSDLMLPDAELTGASRDHISMLLDFLADEQQRALEQLSRQAAKAG